MTSFLRITVRQTADSLERVLALLRRRGVDTVKISAAHTAADTMELIVRWRNAERISADRLRRELTVLVDVLAVTPHDDTQSPTRELLIARLRHDGGDPGQHPTLELVGTPTEIDQVIATLHASDALSHYVRSGEIAVPEHQLYHTQEET